MRELLGYAIPFFGVGGRFALAGDVGPYFDELGIDLKPIFEARLGIGHDRIGGAGGYTNTTVDALVGMNDQKILTLVETFHRADFDAVHVFTFDAVFDDDESHC